MVSKVRYANGEGEASGAHEQKAGSLYPAASTQLKLASGVIGRVIAGSKRTFDENNGNKHDGRRDAEEQKQVGCHAVTAIRSTASST
jgi:hypothetical protein